MHKIATKLYQEFNPGVPLKSPRAKHLSKPDQENYGIRWFDKKRFKDILSLMTIDMQEILLKTMFPKTKSTKKYYKDVLSAYDYRHENYFYVFAITNPKHDIVGWIQYMVDSYGGKLKKILSIDRRSLIFEVSYAKLFNKNYKGVAVNGLKQSINIIRKMNSYNLKDIYITGYTSPNNIASEYVLKANDFIKINQQITYIDEISNVWIKKIN